MSPGRAVPRARPARTSDPLDDPEVLNDLFLQAERGKKTLTQRDKAPFRVTHAGQQARVELDRAEVRGDHQAPARPHHRADPRDARRRQGQGARRRSTRSSSSAARRGCRRSATGSSPSSARSPRAYDPDEAVAKGAALFGLKESLQDEVKEILAADRPRGRTARAALDLDGRLRGAGRRGARQARAQTRLHPDRPGPRAGQHADRQRPEQEPGRRRPDDDGQGRRRLPPAAQRRGPDGADAPTSAPTPPTRRASTSA